MEQLTKTQFILLVLLVSFFTSLVTGIVTFTLMEQTPAPLTQTVSRVIEKTVGQIVPGVAEGVLPKQEEKITISQESLVMNLVQNVSSAVVSVIATKDLPVFEEYYINPFGDDPFLQQFFGDIPQMGIPQYRQKGTEQKQISSGTGFFVSADGYLLTNKHVVSDKEATYSVILNDGRKLAAKVLARDPIQDVAVLKVDGKDFNFIALGESGKIKVGQTVIAIGNTLGQFQNTVSVGVISGLNRTVVASVSSGQSEQLQELIQTDAAINPGNSGGPLLDLNGKVIGINSAVAEGAENVGFALPINIAKKAVDDVKNFGTIKYAYLGVRYVAINTQIKEEKKLIVDYGILLSKGSQGEAAVMSGSPAEKAGLKEGDIILEFNGIRLDQNASLTSLINSKRVGDSVTFKAIVSGTTKEVKVTLDERPESL